MFVDFAGLALVIAITAFNISKNAYNTLQLFELSFGVITSLLIKIYRNISDLKQKYPSLANKFIFFRDKLDLLKNSLIFLLLLNKKLS